MTKKTLFFLPENLYASKDVLTDLEPNLRDHFDIYCIDVSVDKRLKEQGAEAYRQHEKDIEALGVKFIRLAHRPWVDRLYDFIRLFAKVKPGNRNSEIFITRELMRLTRELSPDVVLTTRNYKNFVTRFFSHIKGLTVCSLPHSGFEAYRLDYKLKKVPTLRVITKKVKHLFSYTFFKYPFLAKHLDNIHIMSWSPGQLNFDLVTYHLGQGYHRKHLGNPRFDKYLAVREQIEQQNLKRDQDGIIRLAYCTQPLEKVSGFSSMEKKERYNKALRAVLEDKPQVHLTVIVHPRDSIEYYQDVFGDLPSAKVEMTSLNVLGLQDFQLIISGWSTILMECLLAGIPCVSYNPDAIFDFSRFAYLLSAVPLIENDRQLETVFESYQSWLEDYYGKLEVGIKKINTLTKADSSKEIADFLLLQAGGKSE